MGEFLAFSKVKWCVDGCIIFGSLSIMLGFVTHSAGEGEMLHGT
jgi:hypothetical protein